jgi:hypothetical protein
MKNTPRSTSKSTTKRVAIIIKSPPFTDIRPAYIHGEKALEKTHPLFLSPAAGKG